MSNIFPSLTLESQLSISSSVSKSSITPWDSTFSLVASLSTFSVDLTMFFSTSWFALIFFRKLTQLDLQICFIFMTNGVKRADVSSFLTMFIILSKNKTSFLTSASSSVLMHPNKRFFYSVCTTLSNKFCVTSLTIPSSQTYSTIISVSSSLVLNASFFKIVNCLFRFRRLTPYSFIQTLIHGYKNFRRFSSGN